MSEQEAKSPLEDDISDLEGEDEAEFRDYSEADAWTATVESVLPAIVVLTINSTRNVDGNSAGASEATGCVRFSRIM